MEIAINLAEIPLSFKFYNYLILIVTRCLLQSSLFKSRSRFLFTKFFKQNNAGKVINGDYLTRWQDLISAEVGLDYFAGQLS